MPGPHGFSVRGFPGLSSGGPCYPAEIPAEAFKRRSSACALIAHGPFASPPCPPPLTPDAAASIASRSTVRDVRTPLKRSRTGMDVVVIWVMREGGFFSENQKKWLDAGGIKCELDQARERPSGKLRPPTIRS